MVDLNSPKDIHKMWWILGLWIKKGNSLDKESTLNWLLVRKIGLCENHFSFVETDKVPPS